MIHKHNEFCLNKIHYYNNILENESNDKKALHKL
jgi:hypothetical protein